MSLLRAIVRATTVAALQQATMAGAQVYDSNMTPFADAVTGNAQYPYITVYTDTDDRMPSARGDGMGREMYNGQQRQLNIALEMAVASAIKDASGNITFTTADTDPGLEFSMDLIEAQSIAALFGSVTNPWGDLLRSIIMNVTRMPSRRGGQGTDGLKFASRRTVFICNTVEDVVLGQPIPDDHFVNRFISLANKFPQFAPYATLVQDAVSGAPPLATWQVAQAFLGMSCAQIRALVPDGLPLPFPPIEQAPYDWSDTNPVVPPIENIILQATDGSDEPDTNITKP